MDELKNKVILVAGASRGAGRGIAIELAKAGAHVIITARSLESSTTSKSTNTLAHTAELIREQKGSVRMIKCDHFDPAQIKSMVQNIREKEGRIDVLVNNIWAGYQDDTGKLDINSEPFVNWFWKQPNWRWDNMFNSVKAHYLTSKYVTPIMLENNEGLIFSTTFWDNDKILSNLPYDVSKNAIHRLIKVMDHELQRFGIYVFAISLGWIRTEIIKENFEVDDYNYKEKEELASTESVFYVGKVIKHLILDPEKSEKSGKVFKTGQLAKEYDIKDVDGSQPAPFQYERKEIDKALEEMDPSP